MGNRGCLHDRAGRIVRPHRGRRWIACVLSFKGRRRTLMQPGQYTELFFLDEPTAFAAGHRPCAECRRADYDRFRDAWAVAFGDRPGADAMDHLLHVARIDPASGHQRRHDAPARALPDGAMVLIGGAPHLVWQRAASTWTPHGYTTRLPLPAGAVPVLTPAPVLSVLAAGYTSACHPSVALFPHEGASSAEPPP